MNPGVAAALTIVALNLTVLGVGSVIRTRTLHRLLKQVRVRIHAGVAAQVHGESMHEARLPGWLVRDIVEATGSD